ncbi:MAG: hypothetical protein C0394_05000 [Syntrophus sp. (in: bacteria)]|nr:hypothetical protein [Syntrophus sp. (in: bacteria)]
MKKNICCFCATVLFLLMILGCGGLRYSQLAPEAKDFRPKKIGLLPADAGTYEEARGVIDDIIAGELVKRKWFQDVVAADTISRQLQANEDLRKAVTEYVAKLKTVNFSDPELSKIIGRIVSVDAFLIVNVDYWQYTMENKDKIAKVGMGVKMIDAGTGVVMWKASHHETETYKWIKPELAKVAKKLAAVMIDEMPH